MPSPTDPLIPAGAKLNPESQAILFYWGKKELEDPASWSATELARAARALYDCHHGSAYGAATLDAGFALVQFAAATRVHGPRPQWTPAGLAGGEQQQQGQAGPLPMGMGVGRQDSALVRPREKAGKGDKGKGKGKGEGNGKRKGGPGLCMPVGAPTMTECMEQPTSAARAAPHGNGAVAGGAGARSAPLVVVGAAASPALLTPPETEGTEGRPRRVRRMPARYRD